MLALHDEDEAVRWRALNELIEAYRPALLHFLTATERIPSNQAEDSIQAFLSDRILRGRILERADANRGRLRSLLLKSFQQFAASEKRKEHARKRMPQGGPPIPLEDVAEQLQQPSVKENAMDAAWARQTLSLALDRFREECARNHRAEWWDVFEARVIAPSLGEGTAWTFDQLSKKHGFAKPQDAANALGSAKRAFVRILRSVVADTLSDPREVDNELRNLSAALARESASAV